MGTRRNLFAVLCAALLQWALPANVMRAEDLWQQETPAARDARMAWWREARFGMFIHWGLYAVPAGEWQGKPIAGIGEWIMDRANIPVDQYEPLAKQFNPTSFDAAQWVRIAKDAGMKYIVITSKHHDGFCLFDTAATQWDVVDATPYGKDLLIQLSDECRKQGLKFCTYYSIMDWHHPAQYRGSAKRYNPTKIHESRKSEYMAFMKQQLEELINTCDPEVLWFDGEWPEWYTEEDGREVYAFLRKLKPQLIINNRVGKGRKGMEGLNKGDQEYVGDFGTPEQQIPATGVPGVDWESCMTMNKTWGFKQDDQDWKSASMLIQNLVDIASKGGNYLLNVGPTAQGEFPQASIDRLQSVGKWMKVNGESIYGTTASPFAKLPWGRCTTKSRGDKTTLYLHVFDWPADGKLVVPDFQQTAQSAHLLATGKNLRHASQGTNLQIDVPAEAPDEIDSVIVLEIEDKG
jgi:alpha-L-fucosidase